MKIYTYTDARANLAALLDAVETGPEEAIITRAGHAPVIVIPLAEYESWTETEHLVRDARNAASLQRGIRQLEDGDTVELTAEQWQQMTVRGDQTSDAA